MDLTVLTSLLHASMLSIATLGCLIFFTTPAYRGICLLLALVSLAALFNVLEDQNISREFYLVSPIFVFGFGPALFLAARRLIVGPIGYRALWHFLPMLIALPFTEYTQVVIALGTVWRIAYALLTLQLIFGFNRQLATQRSDASEVSLAWLGWLVGVSAFFNAIDLLRLNFQIELGAQLNMAGYAAGSLITLCILFLLVLMLNNRRAALETLAGSLAEGSAPRELATNSLKSPVAETRKTEESVEDYQSLFAILDREIRAQEWYCQPRLTLTQLSELSGINTRDISRSINLVGGASFNDYINELRIAHIKHSMHASPQTNLLDLALAAGFSSKATFNQSFRKATGKTPSEFRSLMRVENVQNHDSSRSISSD